MTRQSRQTQRVDLNDDQDEIGSGNQAAAHSPAHSMTHDQIARELGLSRMQVLRAEQSALRKLRRMPEARALLRLVRFIPAEPTP